jgi:hypothetical protein
MSALSIVLKQMSSVTTYMCLEKHVSIAVMYPIVCGLLKRHLKVSNDDSTVERKFKDIISAELIRMFKPLEIETESGIPILASLHYPRYKHLHFLTIEQIAFAEKTLESALDDIPLVPMSANSTRQQSTAEHR